MRKKAQNIRPSWRAVRNLWSEEFSFRLQTLCGAAILVLSYAFQISEAEWLAGILVIAMVLAIEALNTAIEELCDHVTPEQHPHIGKIKDMGSGASLLMGIAAVVIGLIIFLPHLISL